VIGGLSPLFLEESFELCPCRLRIVEIFPQGVSANAAEKLSFVVIVLAYDERDYSYQIVSLNALLTPDKVG